MAHSEKQKRILQRLGYYDYQNGLIYRHLNQEGGWNHHLENCRNFIIKAAGLIKPEKVTVLGSGWLLDVPLKELSEICRSVDLIDIVHPPDAYSQVAKLGNVTLTELDITGGLAWETWEKTSGFPFRKKLKSTDDIIVPDVTLPGDPGMVISLNLLSQLDTLPLRRVKEKSDLPGEQYTRFRQRVQKKHLELLNCYPSVLITDTSEIFTDKKGNRSEIGSIAINLPYGEMREEWTWDFDLVRSDYYGMNSVLKVVAMIVRR